MGGRLKVALAVDDESVAQAAHLQSGKQVVKPFRFKRGPKHRKRAPRQIVLGGDHQVGDLPESLKDIADIKALLDHLPEPFLVAVVDPFQMVRPDVGPLTPVESITPRSTKPPKPSFKFFRRTINRFGSFRSRSNIFAAIILY